MANKWHYTPRLRLLHSVRMVDACKNRWVMFTYHGLPGLHSLPLPFPWQYVHMIPRSSMWSLFFPLHLSITTCITYALGIVRSYQDHVDCHGLPVPCTIVMLTNNEIIVLCNADDNTQCMIYALGIAMCSSRDNNDYTILLSIMWTCELLREW